MENPSTSHGTNDNDQYVFDVFINHRGPDVKRTLATALYHCLTQHDLRVFLDEQELQEGENITPQIESAIRTASVHIAIFSPGYADSRWCLDELVLMLESRSKSRSTIIPVFYGVQPSELRWTRGKNGVYARSLCVLEEKKTSDGRPRYDSSKSLKNGGLLSLKLQKLKVLTERRITGENLPLLVNLCKHFCFVKEATL